MQLGLPALAYLDRATRTCTLGADLEEAADWGPQGAHDVVKGSTTRVQRAGSTYTTVAAAGMQAVPALLGTTSTKLHPWSVLELPGWWQASSKARQAVGSRRVNPLAAAAVSLLGRSPRASPVQLELEAVGRAGWGAGLSWDRWGFTLPASVPSQCMT